MQKLTKRQEQIFDFICHYMKIQGMPPTRTEIASHFNFRSTNAAVDHLQALARKGVIDLIPDRSRGIRLKQQDLPNHSSSKTQTDWIEIPIIGRVAAGFPIEAIENRDQLITIPATLFRTHPTYLLRVRGDSMRDAGILDGDLIAVQKTEIAHKGQIIVARIEQDVTVKYLDYDKDQIKLIPANANYQPILISPNDLFIEGVFVGLIRDGSIRL